MIQDKLNQLNAAITTTTFCDLATSVTATTGIPNFAPKVVSIKGKIVIVQSYNILGNKPIKGITLNIKAIRGSMMQHTYPLANGIVAYGASLTPPDLDLIAQAKFPKTYLEGLSKVECATECDRIRQLASTHSAALVPFGITGANITDTGTLVTLYMTGINDPRVAIVTRTSAKKQADLHLKDIMDNLLELQLDTMANTIRYTNTEWWDQYHQSREVIDLGTTFTKLRATCVDVEGDPIKGVLVSLLKNGLVIYSKKTDAAGVVSIVKVEPGDYDIRFEKTGFIAQTVAEYHFAPGSEKQRKDSSHYFIGVWH
jgi:hypothetical protein